MRGEELEVRVFSREHSGGFLVRLAPAGRASPFLVAQDLAGPHVHAPTPGWASLHLDSGYANAIEARSLDAPNRVALVGSPEPWPSSGASPWYQEVPLLLPWAGNWSVTGELDGSAFDLRFFVPEAELSTMRAPIRDGPEPFGLAVAWPSAFLEAVPGRDATVEFTLALYDPAAAVWAALASDARASVAGLDLASESYTFDVPLAREADDPTAWSASVPLTAGEWDLTVNVTGGGIGRSGATFRTVVTLSASAAGDDGVNEAPPSSLGAQNVTVPRDGRWQIVAHGPNAHGEAPLAKGLTGAPYARVLPQLFPAPGRLEGRVLLAGPLNEPLAPTPNASATLEPSGRAVALVPDVDGYAFTIEGVEPGEYRLVVRVPATADAPAWSSQATFFVKVETPNGESPRPNTTQDRIGGSPEEASTRVFVGALAVAALAAVGGLAWKLYRDSGLRGRKP